MLNADCLLGLYDDVNSNLSFFAVFPYSDLLGDFGSFSFMLFRIGLEES